MPKIRERAGAIRERRCREDQNAVDVERSLGVARPRRASAGGGWAVDRSHREESGLGACRKLRSARASRRYPGCAPETRVGDERPAKKLIVSPARSSSRTQVRLVGRTGPWREAGPISTAARRGGVSSRSYSRGSGVDCPTPRRRHLDPYFRLYRDL